MDAKPREPYAYIVSSMSSISDCTEPTSSTGWAIRRKRRSGTFITPRIAMSFSVANAHDRYSAHLRLTIEKVKEATTEMALCGASIDTETKAFSKGMHPETIAFVPSTSLHIERIGPAQFVLGRAQSQPRKALRPPEGGLSA